MAEPGTSPRRGGRELAAALGLATAAAGLALLAAGRTWSQVTLSTRGMPAQEVVVTGADAVPLLRAASLVALAAVGAALVTRDGSRRAVGVLLGLCGGCLVLAAVTAGQGVTDAQRAEMDAAPAAADPNVVREVLALGAQQGGWRWLVLGCGLVLLAVGLATAVRGSRWPAMGRRYQRPAPDDSVGAADPSDPVNPADPLVTWRELDQGRDPTR